MSRLFDPRKTYKLPPSSVRSFEKIIERIEKWQCRNRNYDYGQNSEINSAKHRLMEILRVLESKQSKQ